MTSSELNGGIVTAGTAHTIGVRCRPTSRPPGICSTTLSRTAWFIGPPTYIIERREWTLFAFDPSERPKAGLRSREWTAVAATELECVREMARCLWIIAIGGWPT
jgi:hypothetical protein